MSVLEAPVRPEAQARPREIDLYASAVRQFDIAANILELEDGMRKTYSWIYEQVSAGLQRRPIEL